MKIETTTLGDEYSTQMNRLKRILRDMDGAGIPPNHLAYAVVRGTLEQAAVAEKTGDVMAQYRLFGAMAKIRWPIK